ncbi:hypothetical protein ASD97_10165 [Streptomyces sp. Root63]|uniref:hypothetical protein n=1 Tax=unclassified Streptomyces TaxID=2593676 RepID=UPI0006FD14D6|nr:MULTISPECIES: hypothetical protein [unclassified Streptomyces]KQX36975.1 hypothetical protein ASD29_07065 [Streptomyces sp. Root1295]KRA43963.1 hypothetical protein ASD97_10165 [Streptomyces sp. Root63]
MKITACDLDKQTPAKTYTITPEGEPSVDLDLCGTHAAPIEDLIRKAKGAQVDAPEEEDEAAPVVPVRRARKTAQRKTTPAKTTPAKQTTAKKTTAKKTPAKGPKIMTLEEIEAQKRKQKEKG